MKRLLLMISPLIGMCLIFSCTRNELVEPNISEAWHTTKTCLQIGMLNFDATNSTRAVENGWKNGDVVYMLLTDKNGNKVQAYVTYNGATHVWGDITYEGDPNNLICSTPRKVEAYYFDGQTSKGSALITLTANTGIYTCLDGTYTFPKGEDLMVNIMLKPATGRIRFKGESGITANIGGIKTYTSFLRANGELSTSISEVSTTIQSNGYTPYIYGEFNDKNSPYLTIDDTYKATFDASTSVLSIGLSGFMNLPTKDSHKGWEEIHEYVDLGLPSGTLWATCNVGASKPEEYGDFFAWGETETKTNYDWTTYKWCKGSDDSMTKYCTSSLYGTVDNKTELDNEDDAAYVIWGSDWCMPTAAQQQELIDSTYTTTAWTTRNGVYGRLITSKSNGHSIFLPAVGYCGNSGLSEDGSYGQYWSRSLCRNINPDAYGLAINSLVSWDHGSRSIGSNVRPVRSK